MQKNNLKQILLLIEFLKELELKISQMYKAAAVKWEKEKYFLITLSQEEEKHVCHLTTMSDMLEKNPGQFERGRFFSPMAIRTVIRGIDENRERIKQNKLNLKKMLSIAIDIENSLLERNYKELVKSDNVKYGTLVREIEEDTIKHRDKLKNKLEQYKQNDR